MEDDTKEKGFIIKDKRLFDESGDVRKQEDDQAATEATAESAGADMEKSPVMEDRDDSQDMYLPEVNFANFILSLSTTVMYHFGDFADPATNTPERNLRAAKHAIDTIAMLKSKTEGNLDENEKGLLDGVLFELRMRYVKESGER